MLIADTRERDLWDGRTCPRVARYPRVGIVVSVEPIQQAVRRTAMGSAYRVGGKWKVLAAVARSNVLCSTGS